MGSVIELKKEEDRLIILLRIQAQFFVGVTLPATRMTITLHPILFICGSENVIALYLG